MYIHRNPEQLAEFDAIAAQFELRNAALAFIRSQFRPARLVLNSNEPLNLIDDARKAIEIWSQSYGLKIQFDLLLKGTNSSDPLYEDLVALNKFVLSYYPDIGVSVRDFDVNFYIPGPEKPEERIEAISTVVLRETDPPRPQDIVAVGSGVVRDPDLVLNIKDPKYSMKALPGIRTFEAWKDEGPSAINKAGLESINPQIVHSLAHIIKAETGNPISRIIPKTPFFPSAYEVARLLNR